MRHRLEHDDELGRNLQRQDRLVAGGQFDGVERDLLHHGVEIILGQVDAGAPEDLAMIFPDRQVVGIVRRDPAHARAYREADLDHVVERRLVVEVAERTIVFAGTHALERGVGVQHAAAARAQHVPRHVEQADLRGVQERRDRPLFVEAFAPGEIEHVDATELSIRRIPDQPLDGGHAGGVGRLLQDREQ